MVTVRSNRPSTKSAASAKAILETRWRFEAGIGIRIFLHGVRGTHELTVAAGLDRALLDAAIRTDSSNYLHSYTWAKFLRDNIELDSPVFKGAASMRVLCRHDAGEDSAFSNAISARELYQRFERWFLRRNPDVIAAPSQTMFGAYMRFSGIEKTIKNGRVVYPRLRLKKGLCG